MSADGFQLKYKFHPQFGKDSMVPIKDLFFVQSISPVIALIMLYAYDKIL